MPMKLAILFALSATLLAASDVPSQKPPAPVDPQAPCVPVDRKTYVIGAEDIIGVVVFENRDFNVEHQVRPDGMITIPLIGDVLAAARPRSNWRTLSPILLRRRS